MAYAMLADDRNRRVLRDLGASRRVARRRSTANADPPRLRKRAASASAATALSWRLCSPPTTPWRGFGRLTTAKRAALIAVTSFRCTRLPPGEVLAPAGRARERNAR